MNVCGILLIGVKRLNQILQYNVWRISDIIKEKRTQKITEYLNENFEQTFSVYEKFGLNRNPVYDRTGVLPHYLNISPVHKIPSYDKNFNKSFYQVCGERAKELASLGKPIKVCWSGGIDSTFVLFFLSQYVPKDQLTVYGTYSSVIESGNVFDLFIKDKFKYEIKIYPTKDVKNKIEDCIWVTGFQGNQLFGPTDNFFAKDRSVAFFHHTLGTKETIYENYKKYISPELIEFLQPSIDASPRKIETVADLRWYCIFNFDWYNGLYEMTPEMKPEKIDTIHHFFDTEDFQKWAIHTKEPWTKEPGNPNTHRWQMRDFLYNCGLKDYARNKTKAISCFSSFRGDWLFLLNNYENVYD